MFTFLSGDQGRYRFVIRQSDEGVQPVRDVEIITPETGELAKHAFDARYAGIIDLKAMAGVHPTAAELWVFPNPTRERVSIAIDLDQEKSMSTSTSRRKVDVYILNQIGVEVLRLQCNETDLLHVDVDQLPQGVYNVLVCSTANRMKHLSTSFVLLR